MRILGRSDFSELRGDKYDYCYVCGPVKYRVVVHFDLGHSLPATGETLTGATSGDSGVVESYFLTGGAWGDTDAGTFLAPSSVNDDEGGF